jgi:Ni/Fe-hydrogenase 1 B-type cytochrome subunit
MAVAKETLPGLAPAPPPAAPVADDPDSDVTIPARRQRVRVYTWEMPVRVTHWITFASVLMLTVTGGYIGDPFLIPPTDRTMAQVRFIHLVVAFVFLASGIVRTYWLFAGNRFAHWRAFVPTSRNQFREMVRQTGWYLFVRDDPPKVLGHNALAAGTYLIVFFLFLVQTVTGFALYAVHGNPPWVDLFGWVIGIFGVSTVRLVHHLLMWAIIAFMIHHVYSAILVDHYERTGLMASIFSGSKFVSREDIVEARDGGYDVQGVVD